MNDPRYAPLVDAGELPRHYKEVESFQAARMRSIKRLSKIMIVTTAVALLGNLAQGWTIAAMMPLSRIVPVYLWVRPDGTVDNSIALSRLPGTQNKAVINAALWEYVRLREGFSYDSAQYGYDVVSAFSAPRVREQYQRYFNYPNPESPQVIIGKSGTVNIVHVSSADIATSVQQIRFTRMVEIYGRMPLISTWTTTISYATISNLPAGQRLTNPGGVLVTSYQSSEDTP